MKTSRPHPPRIATWLRGPSAHRLALALVLGLYAVIAFHGIANYWQWGHHGFNGAAFAHAARNSQRFQILAQAQYHTAGTPPPPEALYTHHPLMLHLHLIALMRWLGDAEWVPRLVPALYSLAGQAMLYAFVRRYYGRTIALVSALSYALIPLGAMFANMVNHEQGAIFWSLLFLYAYCRFFEEGSKRMAALSLLAVTVAIQFDWAPYHLALFVAIHAFLGGIRRQRRLLELRREHVLAVVLSIVVLSNFAAFYAFVLHVRGSFEDMMASARQRTSEPAGYWSLVARHAFDLQGPVFLPLLPLFLFRLVTRLVRGEAHLGDLLPVFFTGVQIIQSTVFKEAGFIHAYWTYYLNPALAVAAGSVLVGAARLTRTVFRDAAAAIARRARRGPGVAFARGLALVGSAVAVLVATAPLAYASFDTARKVRAEFVSGFGTYVVPYDDQFGLVASTRHVLRRYPRNTRDALVHTGIAYRIEWLYYLDAPRRDVTGFAQVESMPASQPGRHRLVFADLVTARGTPGLAALVARHRTFVHDDRFVTIDLDDPHHDFFAYRSVQQPFPFGWRWLVNPVHPPIRWERVEDTELLRLDLSTELRVVAEQSFGAPSGGQTTRWRCPDGYALDRLETTAATWLHGPTFGSFAARCRRLTDVPGASHLHVSSPTFGVAHSQEVVRTGCDEGSVIVGIRVDTNPYPFGLSVACRPIREILEAAEAPATVRAAARAAGGIVPPEPPAADAPPPAGAARDGAGVPFDCPPGSVAQGVLGSFGMLTDRIGIACVAADAAFVRTARELVPREALRPAGPDASRAPVR